MKAFSRLLIAAIGAAAFASCTANGGLIYMNIQKTQKTNTSTTIPLDITVADIVNTGSLTLPPYYVAAGKIYNGNTPANGLSWNAVPVPQANGKDMLCNTLAYDNINNLLWGGFFSSDGSTFGLYKMTPPATSASSWTQVSTPSSSQITYLSFANGYLFAVEAVWSNGSYVYQLEWTNNKGTSWTLTSLAGFSKPITGVAFDSTSSTYYATSGNTVYTVITTPTSFTASFTSSNSSDLFQGVFVDSGYGGGTATLVVVPSSNPQVNPPVGSVYYQIGGGAWTNASQQVSGYNVGFLCVSEPVDPGHTTYLLGTDSGTGGAFGFYSFVPGTNSLNRFGGLSYSLYYSAVRGILVDLTGNFVAMGTINNGLWGTTPVDASGGFSNNTWTQE